ncbi:perosamine synthetase [Synechococcus sp. WH 7805]|nr:perosamine synthetase [Synechococcus sp. WH 7805]
MPLYKPWLTDKEEKYVSECMKSTWISSKGKFVEEFERCFSEYVGSPYATTICNGTAALHLALLSLGLKAGDEVIVPTLTYIASVNAITYVGATPVFCEIDKNTWQLDPKDVEKRISSKTKAILAVHLYGHPCDMDKLVAVSQKNNIFLIEDCAEAIGSKFNNKHVGNFGHVSTFSFYGNKTITTGEGGMVTTSDPHIYHFIKKAKGQGLSETREYWHDSIGYNYRMTNICCAIGLAQLEKINEILKKKREIAHRYAYNFKNYPITFHEESSSSVHSYWICSILLPSPQECVNARLLLKDNSVETRPLFPPIHLMPIYEGSSGDYVISEDISERGFNLPSYPELTFDQVDYISNLVIQALKK